MQLASGMNAYRYLKGELLDASYMSHGCMRRYSWMPLYLPWPSWRSRVIDACLGKFLFLSAAYSCSAS